MKLTGRCFCKALEYRAEIERERVGICHCKDCQTFSGSAFRMVGAIAPSEFAFTRGSPTYFDKRGDLGSIRRMAFCSVCGTHICALPGDDSANSFVSLRLSTADQFDQLAPVFEVFCASKVAWLPPIAGALQFDRMPSG